MTNCWASGDASVKGLARNVFWSYGCLDMPQAVYKWLITPYLQSPYLQNLYSLRLMTPPMQAPGPSNENPDFSALENNSSSGPKNHWEKTPAVFPGFLEVFWKEGSRERMDMKGTPTQLFSDPAKKREPFLGLGQFKWGSHPQKREKGCH